MLKTFVVVGLDEIPEDLPFNASLKRQFVRKEGVDDKLEWSVDKSYEFWFEYQHGSLKKGKQSIHEGQISCWVYYSKDKAFEHISNYINNSAYDTSVYKNCMVVVVYGISGSFVTEIAVRHLLNTKFGYTNFYAGVPFVGGVYSFPTT